MPNRGIPDTGPRRGLARTPRSLPLNEIIKPPGQGPGIASFGDPPVLGLHSPHIQLRQISRTMALHQSVERLARRPIPVGQLRNKLVQPVKDPSLHRRRRIHAQSPGHPLTGENLWRSPRRAAVPDRRHNLIPRPPTRPSIPRTLLLTDEIRKPSRQRLRIGRTSNLMPSLHSAHIRRHHTATTVRRHQLVERAARGLLQPHHLRNDPMEPAHELGLRLRNIPQTKDVGHRPAHRDLKVPGPPTARPRVRWGHPRIVGERRRRWRTRDLTLHDRSRRQRGAGLID